MPFVKTALLNSESAENITHFTAVRMRIQGTGNLKMSFISQDNVITQNLAELPMKELNERQPTRLSNFMQQRAIFELHTEKRLDFFRINRIIVFIKETYSSYPG
jgi:hypothetical protein